MRAKFIRGKEPKVAMGIGAGKDGYIITKDSEYGELGDRYLRLDFEGKEWNWGRKVFDPDEVPATKVTPDMEIKLEKLPVVDFFYYWETKGLTGMFGEWPEDFPFSKTPFLANVEEGEGRTFLIEPEGYNYPRYITELS